MNATAETAALPKVRIATTSLAGCFGCHMSFLDIDERILERRRATSNVSASTAPHCRDGGSGTSRSRFCR